MRPSSRPSNIGPAKAELRLLKARQGLTILLLLASASTAFAGCTPVANPQDAPTAPGQPTTIVTLRIGESFTPQHTTTSITFEDVSDDSRCPTDAPCVWAGDATVTLRVQPATGPSERVALHVTTGARSATVAGLHLRLERLEPAPATSRPIDRELYRAAIAIDR